MSERAWRHPQAPFHPETVVSCFFIPPNPPWCTLFITTPECLSGFNESVSFSSLSRSILACPVARKRRLEEAEQEQETDRPASKRKSHPLKLTLDEGFSAESDASSEAEAEKDGGKEEEAKEAGEEEGEDAGVEEEEEEEEVTTERLLQDEQMNGRQEETPQEEESPQQEEEETNLAGDGDKNKENILISAEY